MSKNKKMVNLGLILMLFGGILVAVGGFIYNKYSGKSRNENHEQIVNKQNELDSKIDSSTNLISSKVDTINKKSGKAIVKSETKNIINAPDAVIVTQNQSGGQNTVNIFQNEYKPLNVAISNEVEQKLKMLIKKYPNHPLVRIEIESGNSQRHKIALSIANFFHPMNLGDYPQGNTFMGRFPDYPISVFVNPANLNFANELINALKPFIEGEYKIIKDEGFSIDFIRIYLNGQPSFDNNGSVKIN